ncbi:SDR family oxidoreductase [Nocardia salmonicida]|uniref:SDR family oxidoreductase n=1 Tax=Nocardia salmonicida TaxID=53431 RepID=UPI00363E65DB
MIVVTGATGNVGRILTASLADAGEKVTAVSRGVTSVALPEAIIHRAADLTDLVAVRDVLDGADALFLIIAGSQLFGEPEPAQLLAAVTAAGVGRVVLLSSQATTTRPESLSHRRLREYEAVVRAAGLEWTILQPGAFHSNALAWAPTVRAERRVVAPFGDVGLRLIDPADIAAVAERVLREPGHHGRTYLLTGPVAVTPRQQVAALSAALGEPVDFTELTRDQALAGLTSQVPTAVAEGVLDLLGSPTREELDAPSAVEQVLGRPPRPFEVWARENKAAFT